MIKLLFSILHSSIISDAQPLKKCVLLFMALLYLCFTCGGSMIIVIASIRVKPGTMNEYLPILKQNVPLVCAEKGCIEYAPALDISAVFPNQKTGENILILVEKWESVDALKTHLQAPHMQTYREKVKDFVENVELRILQNI
jgi:quinol monooxygenase YgiN